MKEAIKTLLLAGHYVSFNSNYRISPNGGWVEVKDYLHGMDTQRFRWDQVDEAIDLYLSLLVA